MSMKSAILPLSPLSMYHMLFIYFHENLQYVASRALRRDLLCWGDNPQRKFYKFVIGNREVPFEQEKNALPSFNPKEYPHQYCQ